MAQQIKELASKPVCEPEELVTTPECEPGQPHFRRQEECSELKASLEYIMSLSLAWATV